MDIAYEEFRRRVDALKGRIADACRRCGRGVDEVCLLPVTKFHPVDAALFAVRYGFSAVGENRVQEAAAKRPLAPAGLRWELIGHLQSNKARLAVETFDRIQSVDSAKLAVSLDRICGKLGRRMPVLLQVNAGDDPGKSGVDVAAAPALLEAALALRNLDVQGLMTIAPLDGGREAAARCFMRLRETRDALAARHGVPLPELSMGMTGDLEEAIAAGSTIVRVGTALFGTRETPSS